MLHSASSLVSVLVPVLGATSRIEEAIQSVLDQSYGPIEIIIAPDGAEAYTKLRARFNQDRVRVLNPHASSIDVGEARNRAIDASRGDFFLTVGPGDLLPPEFVERLMSVADNEGCATANTRYVDAGDGTLVRTTAIPQPQISLNQYGRLLAALHPIWHRSLEPGYTHGFANDVIHDGLIVAQYGAVPVVSGTHYLCRVMAHGVPVNRHDSELAIQLAYADRAAQIVTHPTRLGAHCLSETERMSFADIFQYRSFVSRLYTADHKANSYQAFVAGRENELWDSYQRDRRTAWIAEVNDPSSCSSSVMNQDVIHESSSP